MIGIDYEALKKLLIYEQDTGIFKWLISPSYAVKAGDMAGYVSCHRGKRYIKIRYKGSNYFAHRLAWLYVYGKSPDNVIDHIDGNGTNNKINNLRSVTIFENCKNLKKYSNNSSGVTGVSWHKKSGKWSAQIRIKGRDIYLGLFDSIPEAAMARKNADLHYQFHMNHGSDRTL